jgi:hypothetical protein
MDEPIAPPRQETSDAPPSIIGAIAGALALSVALGLVVGVAALKRPAARLGREGLFEHGANSHTSIEASWAEISRKAGPSGSYGWVDRKHGIVQIPIERAIDLVCAENSEAQSQRPGQ